MRTPAEWPGVYGRLFANWGLSLSAMDEVIEPDSVPELPPPRPAGEGWGGGGLVDDRPETLSRKQ